MIIAATARLVVRTFDTSDAPFILQLLNEPAWLRFIGDKQVRNIEDATNYIHNVLLKSYQDNGFGLWKVELRDTQEPIGMCGLIRREALDYEDIGFAFLAAHNGKGYASEAARAVIDYARQQLQFTRLLAIANDDNTRSIHLLEKLGFSFQHHITMPGDPKRLVLMGRVL